MSKTETLSTTINELKSQGYTIDFKLSDQKLESIDQKHSYTKSDFIVDKVYRFEGMSNPSDNSILYAISTEDGKKGTLVDGYGISSGQVSKKLRDKLNLSLNR